jgi:hypothetical protein
MRLLILTLLFFPWCAAHSPFASAIESSIGLQDAHAPTLQGIGREFILSASLFDNQDKENLKLIKDEIKVAAERSIFLNMPRALTLCYELQTTHNTEKKEKLTQQLKKNISQHIIFMRNGDFIIEEESNEVGKTEE